MTDARKFCAATFIGMGLTAAACNHGLLILPPERGDVAILVFGLMFGCLSILIFGSRQHD